MKYKLYILLITILLLGFSCGDDDDDGIIEVPEADRTEQQVIDNDSLVSYLQSHYVDASLLSNNPTISFTEININQLPDDGELPNPNQNSLLIDIVETLTTTYFDVEYEYYILKINQGGSENSPNFSDKVRVSYEGTLMDDTVFDSSSTPVDFDLTSTIAGWGRVLPEFNLAEDFIINSDGTVTYNNPGIGIMFLPSGLGYYSAAAGSVPVYSNLIFKRATMQGFLVLDYMNEAHVARKRIKKWIKDGLLVCKEDIKEGFENAPDTLKGLFDGQNKGKQLLKIAN